MGKYKTLQKEKESIVTVIGILTTKIHGQISECHKYGLSRRNCI